MAAFLGALVVSAVSILLSMFVSHPGPMTAKGHA
jgi:hypothetical protein